MTVLYTKVLSPFSVSIHVCHEGRGVPPAKKRTLGVLDSNSFLYKCKAIYNWQKPKEKFKEKHGNKQEIKSFFLSQKPFVNAKIRQISIF